MSAMTDERPALEVVIPAIRAATWPVLHAGRKLSEPVEEMTLAAITHDLLHEHGGLEDT